MSLTLSATIGDCDAASPAGDGLREPSLGSAWKRRPDSPGTHLKSSGCKFSILNAYSLSPPVTPREIGRNHVEDRETHPRRLPGVDTLFDRRRSRRRHRVLPA